MAKFTAEEKLQAVKRYLNGNESSSEIAKSWVLTIQLFITWMKQYEYHGVEAFDKTLYKLYNTV